MAKDISMPMVLHLAGNDEFVPKPIQDRLLEAFKNSAKVQVHVYAGVNHAFARPTGLFFDEQATALANQRTYDLFETVLKT